MTYKTKLLIIFFTFWCGLSHAENFSEVSPQGITIKSVTDNQDHYKVTGVSVDNSTIGEFMGNIKDSDKGTPDLKKIVLNPNGSGKYFEMLVFKKGSVIPAPKSSGNNKEKFHDKKYNVRVIIREGYFEINGSRYFNQAAIKHTYMNKKGMKLVVCKENNAPNEALNELLSTFSKLNTLGIDVLPGNDCN